MLSFLRSRVISALLEHGFKWLQQVGRSLRQLWLETTGALFICMGGLAVPSALKEWRRYEQGGPVWRLMVVALFMVMTISFGVFSFIRSRRLR